MSKELTLTETDRLASLETTISAGLETFSEVGAALLEIREQKLYRFDFDTFESYCQTRWSMTRQHANRMIKSAEVISNLEPIGSKPENEAQARELAKLPPEQRSEVWQQAQEDAGEKKVTAKQIKELVAKKKPAKAAPATPPPSPEVDPWAKRNAQAAHPSTLTSTKGDYRIKESDLVAWIGRGFA